MAERIKGLQIDLSMKDMGIGATLAGVRRSFKTLNSDLKLSRNNFKNSEKSMTSYKNRIRELDGATKQQRNNVKELRAQYQKTAQEQGANSAKAARLRTEYNKQADTLNYLEHELEQTTSSFKNFQKESQAAARVSNSSFGRLGKSFTEMGPKINKVGESMKSVGRSMSMYVTAPVVAGFGLAAKTSIDFDDSMRKVKATSGATGKEFNSLRDKALEMGAKTKFSASESADALNYMALAGWDSKEMMTGISGVMDLAAASGEDLGQVSDIVTDSLTAFGMEAKDSGKFADVLAQTSSKANTDVKGLGDAFKYAAPVAGALGYSVEDTSVAIGLMSNAGMKGEKAGTALRTMFTNLSKPTKAMKDKMDELGISITDSNGEMLPMRDVMGQLRSSMGGLSKDQQAAAAATIFGKESMSGALAVVNASEKDYKKLSKAIDGSKGVAKEMAEEMEEGIGGSIRKMQSAISTLAIKMGDVLAPTIKKVADFIKGLASNFSNMPSWLQGTIAVFGALAAAIGPVVLVAGLFTASIGSIMGVLGPLMVGIKEAGGAMAFLTSKAPLVATALKGIGSAATVMLGPWGLVIAGVVALGAGLVVAYKKSETFRNIVNGAMNGVKNAFLSLWGVVKTLFNGIKTMWQGDFVSAEAILNKILPPSVVGFIKTTISTIRTLILQVVTAVKDFALKIGAQIMAFWKANGPMIMQAVQNIGNVIKTVFKAIWDFVKPILSALGTGISWTFNTIIVPAVKIAMNIILGIMKLIWPVIKWLIVDTWNAIKGTIQGALDIIMGTIKVFSALFTGNWSAMWSGIKQVVSGVLNMVWGLIQLVFIGKILKVVKLFGGLLKSILSGAWNVVKNIFKTSGNFIWGIVKRIFTSIKNFIMNIFNGVKSITSSAWNFIYTKISGFVRSILNSVRSRFNSLKNSTISIFNSVRNFLYGLWKAVRNKVVSLAQSLWNGVKSKFNSLKNSITSIFNSVRNFLYDIWNKVRNKVVSIATSLWNGVRSKFNSLRNSIKNIIGKVKNNLYDTWDKIWNKVTGVASSLWSTVKGTFQNMKDGIKGFADKIGGTINDMVGGIKKGLNKLIEGVNWVGGKLGIDKKIPKLSTGTDGASNSVVSNGAISSPTLATVNDRGPGNGSGIGGHQEVIQRANGQMFAPKGRDVTVPLGKGDVVHSGRSVQKAQRAGVLPKFSRGTDKKKKYDLLRQQRKHGEGGMDAIGSNISKSAWGVSGGGVLDDLKRVGVATSKVAAKKTAKTAADATKKGKETVVAGTKKVAETLDDVMSYVGSPGKLVNAMLKKFGVDFGNVKGEIPKDMMWDGMWKGLKGGVKSLFDGWLTEASSDGDGGYIDLSHGINFGFGSPPGYPFGRHDGLDIGYPYGSKLYSTMSGTGTGSKGYNGGFGNNMWLNKGGPVEAIYGHMSELAWTGKKKVKPGTYIGKSGGDPSRQGAGAGQSTGPHLHYEMRWNGQPKDPTNWLKTNNGGGKASGKYGSTIKQALGMAGLPQTSKYIKAWQEQARTESTFNPKAKNPSGASGLVQVKPATFAANKLPGHGDIWNPLDNLIAGMRYAKATYGPKKMLDRIGHGLPYKTGGIINSEGMYNLAEDGHSEVVVPLDPARANDAMKLIGYAQSKIKDKKNKRPNDMSNKYGSQSGDDNTNLLLQMIANQQKQLDALMQIASSNKGIEDKNYFPSSREMTKMNNENMALNNATQLMR